MVDINTKTIRRNAKRNFHIQKDAEDRSKEAKC